MRQSSSQFPVCRGVRQGCPLFTALFTLEIHTLLWNLDTNSRIQGLPLPNGGAWKVLAYADDVTVLLGNADSAAVTLSVYDEYIWRIIRWFIELTEDQAHASWKLYALCSISLHAC